MSCPSNSVHKSHRHRWGAVAAALTVSIFMTGVGTTATAQDHQRVMELEVIEMEAEVPQRVARFFIQRDELHYEEIDGQPSFLPELLESVEDEPF